MAHLLDRLRLLQLPRVVRPPRSALLRALVLCIQVAVHHLAPAPSLPRMSSLPISTPPALYACAVHAGISAAEIFYPLLACPCHVRFAARFRRCGDSAIMTCC